MKKITRILQEITKVTTEMETSYPEIYKFLDEDISTLPFREHPKINFEILKEYLDSLNQLLQHYKKTHLINGST